MSSMSFRASAPLVFCYIPEGSEAGVEHSLLMIMNKATTLSGLSFHFTVQLLDDGGRQETNRIRHGGVTLYGQQHISGCV